MVSEMITARAWLHRAVAAGIVAIVLLSDLDWLVNQIGVALQVGAPPEWSGLAGGKAADEHGTEGRVNFVSVLVVCADSASSFLEPEFESCCKYVPCRVARDSNVLVDSPRVIVKIPSFGESIPCQAPLTPVVLAQKRSRFRIGRCPTNSLDNIADAMDAEGGVLPITALRLL
jgi:hypothetical protein